MENKENKMTYAQKLLADGLQEQAMQLEPNDAKTIAETLSKSVSSVRAYLSGDVSSTETGKSILKAARSLIIKREQEIKKLVA